MTEIQKVKETVAHLEQFSQNKSYFGIILGTGLGGLVDHIEIAHSISYKDIPNFPIATVEFHKGNLIFGKLEGHDIIAMQGRFHYYEGYEMHEIVFPVRVLKELGVKQLLISNAGGCMNLDWKKGELMLVEDHINLLPGNPLRGNGASDFGPIFTDMSQPYSDDLNQKIIYAASSLDLHINQGVYVSVSGPNLETKAEYRYLRNIGADVVGMSTVPEVIAANQINLPVAAISVLTDMCDPDNLEPINIDDIISTAKAAELNLINLTKEFLKDI